jgi:nucleoid-associated protein YgaU|tara:strand:- start:1707 stop:2006 length:300 start_codon:yes stop_codon:yes gene_type:complete
MSRYTTTDIIKDEDGKQRKATTIFPTIPINVADTFIITTSADRLDKLANIFYQDITLWWVIAAANGLGKGTLVIPSNTKLRIPAKTDFLDEVIKANRTR